MHKIVAFTAVLVIFDRFSALTVAAYYSTPFASLDTLGSFSI